LLENASHMLAILTLCCRTAAGHANYRPDFPLTADKRIMANVPKNAAGEVKANSWAVFDPAWSLESGEVVEGRHAVIGHRTTG
jgi:hypothetical protein